MFGGLQAYATISTSDKSDTLLSSAHVQFPFV
jgi:hypothetical protein